MNPNRKITHAMLQATRLVEASGNQSMQRKKQGLKALFQALAPVFVRRKEPSKAQSIDFAALEEADVPRPEPPLQQETAFWRVLGATATGKGHEYEYLPNQDSFFFLCLPENRLAFCVCDGAGSALLSDVGSRIISRATVDFLRMRLEERVPEETEEAWRNLLAQAAEFAKEKLQSVARIRSVPLKMLATTCLLGVLTPDLVATLHIGDGAVVAKLKQEALQTLSAPQRGEYANFTTFLTSDSAIEEARFRLLRGEVTHLAVFSDGIQDLCLHLPDYRPGDVFFLPLFEYLDSQADIARAQRSLLKMLQSERISRKTQDDVTLFLALRQR